MTKRFYMDSSRVSISKPGYDAESPPAVSPLYMSFDSRITRASPVEIGLIPSASFNYGSTFGYSQTYPGIPAVDIVAYGSNIIGPIYNKPIALRDAGSQIYTRTSFYLICYTNQFIVTDDAQYVRTDYFGTLNLYYILWQTW